MKLFRLSWYAGIAWAALLNVSYAQELEPRRWAHVPVDSNFVGAAYARTDGDVLFDPVLKIEDATVNIDSFLATYLRSFDWSGKTARFDIRVPYQKASGNKPEQRPLLTLEAHVTCKFRNGIWAAISAGSVRAGESAINGEEKNDQRKESLYAVSAGMPVTRTSSIKIIFLKGRTHKEVGSGAENIALAYIRAL